MKSPNSILITLMGSLGDVARGLTIVDAIKKKYPQTQISWIVEPKCAELVKLHPNIDRVLIFERKRGLAAILSLYRELHKLKFDLCIDLQRHFKSGFISWLSRSSRILGFHRNDSKEFNWLFSNEKIIECPKDLPKIEHYWKFLEYLEIEPPKDAEVALQFMNSDSSLNKFSIKSSDNYILLVLSSSWHSKDWPISGFQKLIAEVSARIPNLKFILSGGKESYPHAQSLINYFIGQDIEIQNLCGLTTLSELCLVVKNAKIVVGPDSGPGHLSALFSVPFIGLFGPTDATRTAPYGEKVSILSARIGCSPCYRRVCPGLDKLCMRMIDPRVVADSVVSMYAA